MPLQPRKVLIIFDFDWSFVDQDTDRWILEVNAPHLRRKMENLEDTIPWTDLVAMMCREAHSEGVTRKNIEDSLKILPVHPAMIRAVKKLKAADDPKATFICLSNANEIFISTILKDKNVEDIFDHIATNPARWKENGLLEILRRVDPNGPQHNCKVGCGPNLCKGEELSAFLSENGEYDKMIYIGDGSNDFCPILRLREQDLALARVDRGLQRKIEHEGEARGLKCEVSYWDGAWEIEEKFGEL